MAKFFTAFSARKERLFRLVAAFVMKYQDLSSTVLPTISPRPRHCFQKHSGSGPNTCSQVNLRNARSALSPALLEGV